MKIHHIGYAVKDLKVAAVVFEQLGFTPGEIVRDSGRNIRICFMSNSEQAPPEGCVELIAPDGPSNPVDGILKKAGPGPYHICYETSDMNTAISMLTKNRLFTLIQPPASAPAINGSLVAFLWNRTVGLIELVEL